MLQDHHAIVQLTHDYCWAIDSGDWDALRSVFVDDAVTEFGDGGQHGIDEIIERVSSALAEFRRTQHMVSTHQIQIDGDEATGRCYVQAQHVGRDGTKELVGARYEDHCVRTVDGWRIAERTIVPMWREGGN